MNVSPSYGVATIVLSALCLGLFAWHLVRTARAYRHFHDERAAVSLVKAVGLLVGSLGLLMSAAGLATEQPAFATSGLSIARGALLIVAATLVLSDVRHGE